MKRLLVLVLPVLFFVAGHQPGLPNQPRAIEAAFPAADLSPNLLFDCLPDQTVSVELDWASSYQGPQWVDISLFDNDFAGGTFAGFGPFAAGQSHLKTPSLAAGAWYFVRVNTLTPDGWAASPTMIFFTPTDCPVSHAPPLVIGGPGGCLTPGSATGACVWTNRPDYDTYRLGETVNYCFYVSQPAEIRIVTTKPDGTSLLVFDGLVNGTGGCVGPFQAAQPLGLRTVRMYVSSSNQPFSETHFYVQ